MTRHDAQSISGATADGRAVASALARVPHDIAVSPMPGPAGR
jgi:hypothetical protein